MPHVRHTPDVVLGAATPAVAAVQSAGPNDAVGKDADQRRVVKPGTDVTELVAPLGLDQLAQAPLDAIRPMIGMVDPLTAPLSELLSPVTGVVCDVTTPIFDSLGSVTRPVADLAMRPTDGSMPSAPAPVVADLPAGDSLVPSADGVPAAVETAALGSVPVRVVAGAPESQAAAGIARTPRRHITDRTPPVSIGATSQLSRCRFRRRRHRAWAGSRQRGRDHMRTTVVSPCCPHRSSTDRSRYPGS